MINAVPTGFLMSGGKCGRQLTRFLQQERLRVDFNCVLLLTTALVGASTQARHGEGQDDWPRIRIAYSGSQEVRDGPDEGTEQHGSSWKLISTSGTTFGSLRFTLSENNVGANGEYESPTEKIPLRLRPAAN